MKAIIDLEWLEKMANDMDVIGRNSDEWHDKNVHYAASSAYTRVIQNSEPIESIIDKTWSAAQQATADAEGYINVNMDPDVIGLIKYKEINGYGTSRK